MMWWQVELQPVVVLQHPLLIKEIYHFWIYIFG